MYFRRHAPNCRVHQRRNRTHEASIECDGDERGAHSIVDATLAVVGVYTCGRSTNVTTDPRRREKFMKPAQVAKAPDTNGGTKPIGSVSDASYAIPQTARPARKPEQLPVTTPWTATQLPTTLTHAQHRYTRAGLQEAWEFVSNTRSKGTMTDGVKYTEVSAAYSAGVALRFGSRTI